MYTNKELCSKCNGKCCKKLPGAMSPEDIGISNSKSEQEICEIILEYLETFKYAIDWWEDDINIYYMRPATKRHEDEIFDPSWGGECVFFADGEGCSLSEHTRPLNCKMLEPREDKCISHIRKKDIIDMWVPYQELLVNTGKKVLLSHGKEVLNV